MAARRVGIAIGAILLALAFFPKATAPLIAIPGPVAAAYIRVYLLTRLGLSLPVVIGFTILSQLANVLFVRIWGAMAERITVRRERNPGGVSLLRSRWQTMALGALRRRSLADAPDSACLRWWCGHAGWRW